MDETPTEALAVPGLNIAAGLDAGVGYILSQTKVCLAVLAEVRIVQQPVLQLKSRMEDKILGQTAGG